MISNILLISIAVTVALAILSYYYFYSQPFTIKSAKEFEDLGGNVKKLKSHSNNPRIDLDLFLPIISKHATFYISQLRFTTPFLILNTNLQELIYNLCIDTLSKSIFDTTTDALSTLLVSPEMTISLIRLTDMFSLYSKRKRLPYYLWLYNDLWDGSISMGNNHAYLKALVHRVRKNDDSDECFVGLMVDENEERVINTARDLYVELMETIPNFIYTALVEVVKDGKNETFKDTILEDLITNVLRKEPPVESIYLKGYTIDIASVNFSKDTNLTFGNEKVGKCPANCLVAGVVVNMVKGLLEGFNFDIENDDLVIKTVNRLD